MATVVPEGWKICELGELVTFQRGHDLPRKDMVAGPYPVAGSNGIIGHHNKCTTKGPGITIGRSGNIGRAYYYESDFWAHNTTLFVKEFKKCIPKYLYFLLGTLDFSGHNSGSAVPSLNRNYIHPLKVKIPSKIEEQSKVASILSSLDDKIELNLQMNNTLESIAQAIFKEWFIDFRFPGFDGELVDVVNADRSVSRLPRGWHESFLHEHLEIDRGLSYKGSGLSDSEEGIPMNNLNSVYEGGGYKYDGIKYYNGDYKDGHITKPGDIVVANTEQGHKHLLIGYPAVIPKCYGEETLYSHHLYRVRPKAESFLTPQFIYYTILNPAIRHQIIGCSNGTTVNMLGRDGLEKPMFYSPPADLIYMFSKLVSGIWERQEECIAQNKILKEIRDSILPKLMSGKIRVND